jgi:DNA invertase Pin-like site-specific DNA recombinase
MADETGSGGRKIGYARLNTLCDDITDQLYDVELDRIFLDVLTRPKQFLDQFTLMLSYLKEGDTLYVERMDRLARNPDAFLDDVYAITARGVRIECIREGLAFPAGESSPIRNLLLLTIASFLHAHASWASERIRETRLRRADEDN